MLKLIAKFICIWLVPSLILAFLVNAIAEGGNPHGSGPSMFGEIVLYLGGWSTVSGALFILLVWPMRTWWGLGLLSLFSFFSGALCGGLVAVGLFGVNRISLSAGSAFGAIMAFASGFFIPRTTQSLK
jgi:hypothetical protein